MGAAAGWLAVSLIAVAVVLATARPWTAAGDGLAVMTAPLAVGWVAQTLFGALTYLVPVLIGGGPCITRATGAVLERAGAARIVALNGALAVAVLPVPSVVRVVCASVVLALLAAFPVLLGRAVLVGRTLRRGGEPRERRPQHHLAGAATGLAVVIAAVAIGGALDPSSLPVPAGGSTSSRSAQVTPTGHTTTIAVEAKGMRFSPARLDVPVGDRLVVVLHNADDDRHDLVLANGARTPRVASGRSATLDAGVIGGDLDG